MGRSTEDRISTIIVVLCLNKLHRISKKVQPFESLASFRMNREFGAEVYVPPLSDEVVADNLSKTVGLGSFVGTSNELFERSLKRGGIWVMDKSNAIISRYHANHVNTWHESCELGIHNGAKSVSQCRESRVTRKSGASHFEVGYLIWVTSVLGVKLKRRLWRARDAGSGDEDIHVQITHSLDNARMECYVINIPLQFFVTTLENLK